MTAKLKPALPATVCVAVLAFALSCDIGNWDISRSAESRRNVQAFEQIDFITGEILSGERRGQFVEGRMSKAPNGEDVKVGVGAYPLAFGVSTQRDSVGITGGGHISRRFHDGRWIGVGQNGSLPGSFNPNAPAGPNRHSWLNQWGSGGGNVAPVNLPEASPNRGNPYFRQSNFPEDVYRVPPVIPPGFIEVAGVSTNRGGKIAGSEDGIAFLYREIPLDRNFILEADLLIVQYGNIIAAGAPQNPGSNGQEGFGVMVRDYVPQIPFPSGLNVNWMKPEESGTTMPLFESNGYRELMKTDVDGNLLSGIGRDESRFWAGGALHGGDSNLILAGGTKRGLNMMVREGVTADPALDTDELGNLAQAGLQNPIAARFRYWPDPFVDPALYTEEIGGVRVPTLAARPNFPRWGSTVRVRLERTNDGFAYSIVNLDDRYDNFDGETGRLIEANVPKPSVTSSVYGLASDRDILGSVNKTHMYAGFFAARDAAIWVSNIRYYEADRSKTAPASPVLPGRLEPSLEVLSPAFYTGINTIYLRSNTSGRISVLQNGERIPDGLVTAEFIDARDNGTGRPMTLFTVPIREPALGDTVFSVLFTPGDVPQVHSDANLIHSSNDPIRRSFTVSRIGYDGGTDAKTGRPVIYAAPTAGYRLDGGPLGSPAGNGTRENPLDIQTAINHVLPGQHIILLNGRYVFDRQIVVPWFNDGRQDSVPGKRDGMKVLRAETVNQVWLDWNKREDLAPRGGDGSLGAEGFLMRGSFWHFDGFHMRGAPNKAKGMSVGGSNNIFTRLTIYNNGDTGMQISFSDSIPRRFWPSDNVVMWTESFHNLDDAQTDADGFGVKLTAGARNQLYSIITHNNNDDGVDLFSKRESGPIGITTIDRSVSYLQGWMLNFHRTNGGSIGFKMGGESLGVSHEIRNSLSFANTTSIGSNSNPNMLVRNSTAINSLSTSDLSGADAIGVINITGPAPVGGNAFDSIGDLNRNGFSPDQPQGTNVKPDLKDVPTNWRDFMVTRPASFWGEGDASGSSHPQPATAYNIVNSTVGSEGSHATRMPADYKDWTEFKLFLPRDEYYAYPILRHDVHGELYRVPGITQGAEVLHTGIDRRSVTEWIPWAEADNARPWNGK